VKSAENQSTVKFEEVLSTLGTRLDLHSKLINTFSLLEYIGARKIVKSQTDRTLDQELLGHIAEEIRHAQILKSLALKLSDGKLETFEPEHCIAPQEARSYIQQLDQAARVALTTNSHSANAQSTDPNREWANYLLTTLLLEERAAIVYPTYDAFLERFGLVGKLSSIVKDEDKHLGAVEGHLKDLGTDLSELPQLRELEKKAFATFMQAVVQDL
jgi:rubrerythrin